MPNNSPWIHQLNKDRKPEILNSDIKTDVVVIGGGIAGVSTAFFLLSHTEKNVVLVEADKLAHGATGHNAGQITSYFERPFSSLVEEFGLEMASMGQRDVEEAWSLVDQMYTEAGLDIPMSRFIGFAGLSTQEQVWKHLEDNYWRRKGGLRTETLVIAEEASFLSEIPEKYHGLFSLGTQHEIGIKLETFDPQYIALLSAQKGVMNSALFCQEVITYLLQRYPERFSLYEHTPIAKVVLKEDKAILDAVKHVIECEQVVLCTNGFDKIEIYAPSGLSIDTRFHHSINGVVAFMSGFLEKKGDYPVAISYFQKEDQNLTDNPGDPYFYVTRRPYEYNSGEHNLVSVGGPDFALEDRAKYDRSLEFSESAKKQISDFVRHTYDKAQDLEYTFMWHGMMGYTNNLMRMVGPDPENSRLFYNLGCNGVGILPSIFGGDKVARQIKGEEFSPSMFDIPTRLESTFPLEEDTEEIKSAN